MSLARYWSTHSDGRVRCEVCPRECLLQEGQRGFCFIRRREGDQLHLTSYGRSSGFCIDPIEKKPLAHFYPGTSVLSFGTAGCNLSCQFCQNWELSKSRAQDSLSAKALPEAIAAAAVREGCRSVAFTYNDPVIFAEYAIDVAQACRAKNIATVAVTAGYVQAAARRDFFAVMDAANVDLKAFTEDFYERVTGAKLQCVLETLEYIAHETKVWLELTTLLIPGYNDSDAELMALCAWVRDHLGSEVPLHFSAFHPDFRLLNVPRTPPQTLQRARRLALAEGLHHVYVGNVHDPENERTLCKHCGEVLIARDWYQLLAYHLTPDGRCPRCTTPLAGRFSAPGSAWGRHRKRLSIQP